MTGQARTDRRGLAICPWGCRALVRRTVNANAKPVFVDVDPDPRGIIAAWWDGAVWRSRQLHKNEGLAPHEDRWLIHRATCVRLAARERRTVRQPRPVVVPPPPGPMPAQLAEETRRTLDRIRRARRGRGQDGGR